MCTGRGVCVFCAVFSDFSHEKRNFGLRLRISCRFFGNYAQKSHKDRRRPIHTAKGRLFTKRTVAGRFTQQRPPLHEAALLNTCFRVISVIQKRIDLGIYNCDCEIVEKDRELAVFVAEGIACVKVSLGSQGVLDAERVANLQKRACIRLKC